MEDYDKFVQRRYSQLRKTEEKQKTSPASSVIFFYGEPILPPLLSEEQREEMQRHREAAQKHAVHRKFNQRMAYVENLLHSVQPRSTPTLEGLLQELKINTKSSSSHNTSNDSVLQSNFSNGTKNSLSLSPPPVISEKDSASLPPMSSTTYSAFLTSNVKPQQSYQERCLTDQQYSQQASQPGSLNGASHWSPSSGYVTCENIENTTSDSRRIHLWTEGHDFGSMEGAGNMGDFFLHSTSNTIAKMPAIISHPPIDGEELERSGQESTFCNSFIAVNDVCCTLLQEDSVICDQFSGENLENTYLDSTETQDNLPFTTVLDISKDQILEKMDVPVPSLGNSGSEQSDLSQTSITHNCPVTHMHIQHGPGETELADIQVHKADSMPPQEPYHLSLQCLLKKSQAYRCRQRMIRNQAKNTKIQERAKEQPRMEEQSLSDKENDEFPYKGTVTSEGKKTKEKRGTFKLSVATSLKESCKSERMIEDELNWKRGNSKSKSTGIIRDGNSTEMTNAEEETTLTNNSMNISEEVITTSKKITDFLQHQPMSTETSPFQEAHHLTSRKSTKSPTAFFKYHTIPAPNFCTSPVSCKSKSLIKGREAVDRAETLKVGALVNEHQNLNDEEGNLGHQTCQITTVNQAVEGNASSVLGKSSQHIDQLVSNLSSLKVLISDLESTLAENLDNQSQTERILHGHPFESIKKHIGQIQNDQHMQLRQSDCQSQDYKLSDEDRNDVEKDQRHKDWSGRQSCKNLHKDSKQEQDDDSLVLQKKEAAYLKELRLVEAVTTEQVKDNHKDTKVFINNSEQRGGCKKTQPQAKCIISVAQRMRVPDVFRNFPSEPIISHNVPVLLDTSNHSMERKNELDVEVADSTYSSSLNQSYDVNTPSGLWLFEGPGSDQSSIDHPIQEKHLTPESGDDSEGGVSKVKRRLLMHVSEEIADTVGGAGPGLRHNSSTPRAEMRLFEGRDGQKNQQKQLIRFHAAQVRALQDEHRRQQDHLLHALEGHYSLLQSMSFPCSMASSRLGDKLTFPPLSQPSGSLLEHYRPLLLAAVKGFLTRRMLRTERVAQLVLTIKDTQHFLQAFRSSSRGEICSKQDLLLQERVTLQLRAARYEVHDIFFSLSTEERMQLIHWDRELLRERELRLQTGLTSCPKGKSSLSAATQKSLERKRGIVIQKKTAERQRGVLTVGRKTGISPDQPPETKRGQFRANPKRVPKSTYSSRP